MVILAQLGPPWSWLLPACGVIVMGIVAVDVFLTVLYARAGSSLITKRLVRAAWWLVRVVSDGASWQPRALSYFGSLMLVLLILVWSLGLTLGAGLIFYPFLGTAIRVSNAPTPTDFVSALFAAAQSMSIVGAGSFSPQTTGFRIIYMINSLLGMSMISLTLTYLMQVYSALQRRTAAALSLELATDQTGDAAEILTRLGLRDDLSSATDWFSDLASELVELKEMSHLYSLLIFFRFREPMYAVPRVALVALDAVTLVRTALDGSKFNELQNSVAVNNSWQAAMRLLESVETTMLDRPRKAADDGVSNVENEAYWTWRYGRAVHQLREAGIQTVSNVDKGARQYAVLRAQWAGLVKAYADDLAYRQADVDAVAFTNA